MSYYFMNNCLPLKFKKYSNYINHHSLINYSITFPDHCID